MLDRRAAAEFVAELDLDEIDACALCLMELAWWEAPPHGHAYFGLVRRTAGWVWGDIEEALRAEVVRARMREVHRAEDALRDLDEHAWRCALVREVVAQLAQRLAAEMRETEPP